MSRFSQPQDPVFQQLNASISFDWRLGPYDIEQSRAHAKMLAEAQIISVADRDALLNGLDRVTDELDSGAFEFLPDDEDIHMAIERRLTEIAGPVGGKLHTARSSPAACAREPSMSCGHSRRSKSIDALMRANSGSGGPSKRGMAA